MIDDYPNYKIQVDEFKAILNKYPERRIKTLDRMRGILASRIIGRDFNESMEAYYIRRPDIKASNEAIKILIDKYE